MDLLAHRDPGIPLPDQNLYKAIWVSKVSPKLHLFIWKITQRALSLGENLTRRGILNNIPCSYCGEPESTEHVFLHCSFTRRIWSSHTLVSQFNPSDFGSFAEAFLRSSETTNLQPLGVSDNLFPWICWRVWTARNYKVFENRVSSPAGILSKSIRNAKEWCMAQSPPPTATAPQRLALPPALTSTSVIGYIDAVWQAGSNIAGCGWVFKDHHDECLQQGTKIFNHISSALMAEALAVRSALLNAFEAGFS